MGDGRRILDRAATILGRRAHTLNGKPFYAMIGLANMFRREWRRLNRTKGKAND